MNAAPGVSAGVGTNLEGEKRLQKALEDFKRLLSPQELSQIATAPYPDATSVATLMQELNNVNSKKFLKLGESCKPFLQFVQHFSPVLDVYIQADPTSVAPLVWGSVRLVVQIASGFFDYFVKMTEMFQRIGRICPTMQEIGDIFSDDEKLKDSIRMLYAISMEFCIEALCFLRKPGMKQFAKSIWKPFKLGFRDIENELAERRQIIDDQIRVASEKAAAFARQKALIYQKDGYRHREYEVAQWDHSREWRLQQDTYKREKAMDELLEKLSDHDHTRPFLRAKDLRHPDTGKLFFESPQFKSWYDGSGSSLLWYQGIPGAGKTILASGVIDHLLDNVGGTDKAIIYFFCDSQDIRSLERRTLLSSLLKQIITLNRPLPPFLHSQLETRFDVPQRQPSLNTLQDLLITHVKQTCLTYIVVDGVDELEVRDRQYILNQLSRMLNSSASKLKVFILSRPEIDLPQASRKAILASPQSAPRPELDAYIRDSLQEFDNLKYFPPKFMNEIQAALINGADGMFLWVEFQLREIENKDSMAGIRKVIQDLPRGLDETYVRILKKIMEHRNPEKALKIFKWLSTSRRPLTLGELQEAIAINTDDTYYAQIKNRKTADSLFELRNCANLAVLNERDNTVQFAHSTVRDFLFKESTITEFPSLYLDSISAKSEICNACLTYLSLGEFETQIDIVRKEPLSKKSILENPVSWVPTLLKPRSIPAIVARFYLNWRRPNGPTKSPTLFRQKIKEPPNRLEVFCQAFTLLDYVRQNWMYHCDDLVKIAKGTKAWQIFRMLLEKTLPFDHLPWEHTGLNPDLVYFDEFSWALLNGNLSVLTLIFDEISTTERQRYVNITVGEAEEPPLHIAVGLRTEGIVALLLQNGANPNSSYNGTSALAKASASGRLENVRVLLAAKAYANADGYYKRTALQAAAENGHLGIVEKLLAANANVNAAPTVDYGGRTALQAAAEGGHLDVVERLLVAEANINAVAVYDGGRTALQAAAENGYFDVVERLLAANANVNASAADYNGRTALQAAAENGHLDVVERLLAANANVNAAAVDYGGRTALQAAAGGGHLDVVERLLTVNADVNAVAIYGGGRTALQAAAESGYLDVVERLLAANANVNAAAADYNGRTALQAAAKGGHLNIAERLRAAGAKNWI